MFYCTLFLWNTLTVFCFFFTKGESSILKSLEKSSLNLLIGWLFVLILLWDSSEKSNVSESTRKLVVVVVVQSLSHLWLFETPWTVARQAPLSCNISWSLIQFTSIELVKLSNLYLIICCLLLLLHSVFASIRVISNELALHFRWPNYWSFSFSISPSSEYSGLISFRTD